MVAHGDGRGHRRRRDIGATLRRLRNAAGRTEDDAAAFLDCPQARLVRIEAGLAAIRVGEVNALLDLYGVANEQREETLGEARRMRDRCWWRTYADVISETFETQLILEDEASALQTYQPNLVPGLLQTERYATELIETQSDLPLEAVHRRASLRTLRQQVLARPDAPRLSVIIDEAVLRRPVGSRAVMRDQYARLAECASAPGMTIQVLPFRAGPQHALRHGFHIFAFGGGAPPLVELELLDRVQFVAEPDEVAHYEHAFERASSRALDARHSRLLLAEFASAA